MKVLHAAAEIFPLIKTGGLADVVAALPVALTAAQADVRLVLPGFPAILAAVEFKNSDRPIAPIFGAEKITLRLGRLPHSGLLAYVIDAPHLYQRQGNPYLASNNAPWPDNAQRFALLGWVAAQLAMGDLDGSWTPDILHAHDWHAAMACAYLAAHPARKVASIFTIHNLAYQGLFPADNFNMLGLHPGFMAYDGLEFYGQLSFMKAGIRYADRVTTVSPRYAEEIATTEFGHGLEGLIKSRGENVKGILNGVDEEVWNPASDAFIAQNYSGQALQGKVQCKLKLQQELGLKSDELAPLFAVVSRLTAQKGLDLLLEVIPAVLANHPDAQFVIQGNGDASLESAFGKCCQSYPQHVAVRYEYNESLAHKVIAGADVMLVPSRFEPCGLTQLYALRYGTVPLVRRVGGLYDTVIDVMASGMAEVGTGFTFGPATSNALGKAMEQTISVYRDRASWKKLLLRGMAQNFSWNKSAKQYLVLYTEALESR